MRISEITIGGVYRNKTGLYRKVISYARYAGRRLIPAENLEGSQVVYVPCDELGNPTGEKADCWYNSFARWAKERVESDGKTPIQRVEEFKQSLRDAGRAYCADYIDEAFRLYGIKLPNTNLETSD